ncbi:TNF receptor-associated factor 4-like isoform X5 [Oopsacas minuta]|uniref:TNF receptor-associated factor 4-like isoform X5 n=1 Tax=Oopsacas minuta TaxID=111878 RepID=A0AAV7K2M6_9METZ|nr:TNF receptor-associated factor 4-like isoform X5 [Oopsacas minuta]
MATESLDYLEPEIGKSLCRVRRQNGNLGGYRTDILVENISKTEMAALVCKRCQGILRKACFSATSGEYFCKCCKNLLEQAQPNGQLRKIIHSLKSSCPLYKRGCEGIGKLGKCEKHLNICEYVYEQCKLGCEIVLPRHELKIHVSEKCNFLEILCEHCQRDFKVCDMPIHSEECPAMLLRCELKCGTVVCREDMAQHLEKYCRCVIEHCKLGCGIELSRDELEMHVNDECVQRMILCKHCKRDFKVCDMSKHSEVCPKMLLKCELECDTVMYRENKPDMQMREKHRNMPNYLEEYQNLPLRCELRCGTVVCREDMAQHIEEECVEKKVECPFIKYKCGVGLIRRKELNQHLKEKRTEHTKLKLSAMEEIIMQQSEMIRKFSNRFTALCSITKTTKLKWRIENIRNNLSSNLSSTSPLYEVAGFKFSFNLSSYASINIHFPNQETSKSAPGKLNWPFKAKFLFRLICHNDPNGILEYRSRIEIKQKDCNKSGYISDPVAQINAEHATSMYYMIDGGIDLEILVILQ